MRFVIFALCLLSLHTQAQEALLNADLVEIQGLVFAPKGEVKITDPKLWKLEPQKDPTLTLYRRLASSPEVKRMEILVKRTPKGEISHLSQHLLEVSGNFSDFIVYRFAQTAAPEKLLSSSRCLVSKYQKAAPEKAEVFCKTAEPIFCQAIWESIKNDKCSQSVMFRRGCEEVKTVSSKSLEAVDAAQAENIAFAKILEVHPGIRIPKTSETYRVKAQGNSYGVIYLCDKFSMHFPLKK